MAKRKHDWNEDTCRTCGCVREWRDFTGYWRFTWEDGRVVQPNGSGAPPCEGFANRIIEACVDALSGAESMPNREKVKAVLGVYQDISEYR